MKKVQAKDNIVLEYLQNILDTVTKQFELSKIANKEFLTIDEAAIYLGYSTSYVYQLVSRGLLPKNKPQGGRVYISKTDLNNFINRM